MMTTTNTRRLSRIGRVPPAPKPQPKPADPIVDAITSDRLTDAARGGK